MSAAHRRLIVVGLKSRSTRSGAGLFDYIEAFYNRRRRHSRLGMLSPVQFENSTLMTGGASLAASRLAPTNKMDYNSTSKAQAA
jgi:hypothetical protein